MTAVATGVNLDTTGVVNQQCAITAVEAPAPQVVGSLLLLGEFASPVDNQNTSGTDRCRGDDPDRCCSCSSCVLRGT